jgi:RND family efflux transporter MFP subunit
MSTDAREMDGPPPAAGLRGKARRAAHGLARLGVTLAVVGGAALAVHQGATVLAERAEAAEPPPGAPALPVEVRRVALQEGFATERRFLGRLAPMQDTALSFEAGGRVMEMRVEEGDTVAAGAVVARLDTALLDTQAARLAAARAALEADYELAGRRLARRSELQDRGFSPEAALDEAELSRAALAARLREVDAQIREVEVRRDKAVLRAPFPGRVAARAVDTGATVAAGQTVLRLMQEGAAELRVGLPLWVDAAPGTDWPVEIEGRPATATLVALRPDIDPDTRTRTALLRVDDADAPFGATATLAVPRRIEATGAWLPRTALREGAPGVWTVLVLDAENVVRAVPVEVLHAEADRVYLAGPFDAGMRAIAGGTQRVTPGQTVAPIAGGE